MYAKILMILVLAILCTGCTDPDLPDPYEFENVTPGAPALQKSWNPETQMITISTLDDTPRLTIRKISTVPDLCTFEEVLEIKSFVDYDLNKLKDFRARWKKHKGQHDISKVEWFILKNESYHITVNDYETVSIEETHYDNVTGEYYNVMINQTNLTGNHSEVRYHGVWKPFSPAGKSIHAGQTYTVKIVYHKPPELGNVRIQTIPMFVGVECGELTWWNTSWGYKIDSVVADANFPYQMNLTVHSASGSNNATDVFLDGHNNTNFTDIRFTLNDVSELAYRIKENTTDPAKVWINVTTNGTVNMYYGNPSASDASDGDAVFPYLFNDFSTDTLGSDWLGNTASFEITGGYLHHTGGGAWHRINHLVSVPSSNDWVLHSEIKSAASGHRMMSGLSTHTVFETDDSVRGDLNGAATIAWGKYVNGGYTLLGGTWSASANTYHTQEIRKDGTTFTFYLNDVLKDTETIAEYDTNYAVFQAISDGYCDLIYIRKYADPEPTWGVWSSEQTVSIITAYTPSTPLKKTVSGSQLFTVNTSENSQCRWYINGSLKQTNSTGATRHEYTNTSLDEGYWNFTVTANTTDSTSSQTWWVTVTSADEFVQDMYAGRWMYVTYLNGSNTNLSEFFTDLAPYYLSFYNSTDQKTYNYKSGRWEKYADKIIKPGEAAMLRYTANVTKTRDNAPGTFGFTMKTGLNHIGHSYNGSRNLAWYNTTIASANLVTITHQNPETGTLSTYTYGGADNGSVDVLQGCGVEVNVSADTVISGL